jgi:type II secretory pathway pseudopilin PulG
MRRGRNYRGYTIVEVMLFMAISGLMFVLAANFISGKQSKAEFKQGLNDLNSQLQTTINDVSNGFYPSNNSFTCTAGTGVGSDISIVPIAAQQGSNKGCVFLGKVIQIGAKDVTRGPDDHAYDVYSVGGRQFRGDPTDPTVPVNFAEARPKPITSITEKNKLSNGMQVIKMFSDSVSNHNEPIQAIGFYGSFGSYVGSDLQSGAQDITVVKIPGAIYSGNDMSTTIPTQTMNPANLLTDPNITICLDSGTGQFGTVKLGGNTGQRFNSVARIYNSKPSECT